MPKRPPDKKRAIETHAPSISPGAQGLLAIACKRDPARALALNVALNLSLRIIAELPGLCAAADRTGLHALIGQEGLPETFFGFLAALANSIDTHVTTQVREPRGAGAPIEMTHSVLLALGQALSEAVRKSEDDNAPLGPKLPEALRRLADVAAIDLQHSLVLHYVGNILQDYFDSCHVRLQVPELPWNTEQDLRQSDARIIADTVFREVPRNAMGADAGMLQERLRDALIEYANE